MIMRLWSSRNFTRTCSRGWISSSTGDGSGTQVQANTLQACDKPYSMHMVGRGGVGT
jgi:hypothetical protein